MKCTHQEGSDTIETRVHKDGLRYRRRQCHVCSNQFNTVEVPREWVEEYEATKGRLARITSALKEVTT